MGLAFVIEWSWADEINNPHVNLWELFTCKQNAKGREEEAQMSPWNEEEDTREESTLEFDL